MGAPGTVTVGRRYALGEKIGAGGHSEVWRAIDIVLARPVAIKPGLATGRAARTLLTPAVPWMTPAGRGTSQTAPITFLA